MDTNDIIQAMAYVEARAQTALDGNGHAAWTLDYVLEIVREIRDFAADAQRQYAA